jgi:adenylate kinase
MFVQVIKKRLNAYNAQAEPVEQYFSSRGILLDFEITGGIPETLPLLYQSIKPHVGNWNLAELEVGTSAT